MAKTNQKKNPHRLSDKFYDALVARKGEVLRYVIAALVTALVIFLIARFFVKPESLDFIVFLVRFPILFFILKYWVYRQYGAPFFYVARQLMIAIMAVTMVTLVMMEIINLVGGLVSGWMGIAAIYALRFMIEFIYFIIYQFFIFKND